MPDLGALRLARVKNTFWHFISDEDQEDEDPSVRQGLRRARSASSIGAAQKDSDFSLWLSDEEDSVADVAGRSRRHALTEALLWADMADDEPPLTLTGPGAPQAHKPLLQAPQTTAQKCVLQLADQGRHPLLAARRDATPPAAAALGRHPQLAAGREASTRTPLSSKSRPFVSGHRPTTPPLGQRGEAALVGASAEFEGSKGVPSAKIVPEMCTTVLLRGVPSSCNREMLIKMLDDHGYAGRFNFVYLPVDFESSDHNGYAFVNITTPAIAAGFKRLFDGFSEHPFSPSKVCTTEWSRLQGLSANIKHYRNSPIMHKLVPDEHKPVLLAHGVRRPFPKPTTEIKEAKKHRVKRSKA
jgi:hypothetical protein